MNKEKWITKVSRTTGDTYYKNIETGITQWENPYKQLDSVCDIKGLEWVGNSCYLDSTILALFFVPSRFTDRILNTELQINNFKTMFICGNNPQEDLKNRKLVQKELKRLVNHIRGDDQVKQCSNLRQTFKNCPNIENYFDSETKDAGEFLAYILNIFQDITNTSHTKTMIYGTNSTVKNPSIEKLFHTRTIEDRNSSVIQHISSDELVELQQSGKKKEIKEFIQTKEDNYPNFLDNENLYKPYNGGKAYKRRIQVNSIIDTPFIVFDVKRVNLNNEFIKSEILPNEDIQLPNGKEYKLQSIVLFNNGHYTCMFKHTGIWYEYNDLNDSNKLIKKIPIHNNKLTPSLNPNKNGTQYYYKEK